MRLGSCITVIINLPAYKLDMKSEMKTLSILSMALSLVLSAGTFGISYAATDGFQDTFDLDNCNLLPNGSNDYFFLEPGYQLTLEGEEERETVQLVVTVLNETKMVDGVETRIVEERESVDGELDEISVNFFAICKETGDIYYFGEEVDMYEDGKVASHEGEWQAGVDDARAGLIVPADPKIGMKYYQEFAPKIAEDRAEIVSLSEMVDTPAAKFNKVLKVEETNPLEGNEKEYKFHAPGIGLIQDENLKLIKYTLPQVGDEEPEKGKPNGNDHAADNHDRRKMLADRESGEQIHQRHISANPASPGEYTPGLDFTLKAEGSASGDTEQDAEITIDVSVWKSNGAIVIMDVTGGTVTIGDKEYEIKVGYALYSLHHNVFRSAAIAVGEDGSALPLRLYGTADADAELAARAGGDPVKLAFDDAQQKNFLDEWAFKLDGNIQP